MALGIAVAVAQVGATYFASRHQPDAQPMDAFAYALLAGSGLALIARRRHPVLVLAAIAAAVVTYHALAYANGPFFLSLVIALMGAVLGGHRRAAWITAGAAFAGFFVLAELVGRQDVPVLGQAAAIGAWLLLILVAAEFARTRRDQAVEAFHARAEEERRRASEERLRVARELHDVLAHNISLINVQAGVALHLMDEQPEQARTALTAIKQASKDALGELRSVLGVLRQPDDAAPLDPAPRPGPPRRARRAGPRRRPRRARRRRGRRPAAAAARRPGRLPHRAGGAHQRRPARRAGARPRCTLRYGDDRLVVAVDDDGRGRAVGAGDGDGRDGQRPRRHAGAGGGARRRAGGRAPCRAAASTWPPRCPSGRPRDRPSDGRAS